MSSPERKREIKNAKALAQVRRDQLLDEHTAAKLKKAYIGLVYSIIRKEELAIPKRACVEHFFACEGDSNILHVEYVPPSVTVRIGSTEHNVRYDAIVRFMDHRVEYRSAVNPSENCTLREKAAEALCGTFLPITPQWLNEHGQRIANWKRALAAYRMCSRHSLNHYKSYLSAVVLQRGVCKFGELLELYGQENRPLALAAIVELIGSHTFASDLDSNVWGRFSTVWIREHVS